MEKEHEYMFIKCALREHSIDMRKHKIFFCSSFIKWIRITFMYAKKHSLHLVLHLTTQFRTQKLNWINNESLRVLLVLKIFLLRFYYIILFQKGWKPCDDEVCANEEWIRQTTQPIMAIKYAMIRMLLKNIHELLLNMNILLNKSLTDMFAKEKKHLFDTNSYRWRAICSMGARKKNTPFLLKFWNWLRQKCEQKSRIQIYSKMPLWFGQRQSLEPIVSNCFSHFIWHLICLSWLMYQSKIGNGRLDAVLY